MSTPQSQFMNIQATGKQELDRRLEAIGWGTLLILIGAAEIVPEAQIPAGTWAIALGLILLALNITRFLSGIETRWFTTVLGISFLLAGLGKFSGLPLPFWPILIILIGAYILLKPWLEKQEN